MVLHNVLPASEVELWPLWRLTASKIGPSYRPYIYTWWIPFRKVTVAGYSNIQVLEIRHAIAYPGFNRDCHLWPQRRNISIIYGQHLTVRGYAGCPSLPSFSRTSHLHETLYDHPQSFAFW